MIKWLREKLQRRDVGDELRAEMHDVRRVGGVLRCVRCGKAVTVHSLPRLATAPCAHPFRPRNTK